MATTFGHSASIAVTVQLVNAAIDRLRHLDQQRFDRDLEGCLRDPGRDRNHHAPHLAERLKVTLADQRSEADGRTANGQPRSVRSCTSRARVVTGRLYRPAHQPWNVLWTASALLEDVFAIQDEIATTIAERLKVTLADQRSEPMVVRPTANLEAYELYVKGRAFLYQRGTSLLLALECFERAVELDPSYAHAWGPSRHAIVFGHMGRQASR